MRRLAQRTEYSPGTIYLHFRSKEELLDCLVEESFAKLHQQLAQRRQQGMRLPIESACELAVNSRRCIGVVSEIGRQGQCGQCTVGRARAVRRTGSVRRLPDRREPSEVDGKRTKQRLEKRRKPDYSVDAGVIIASGSDHARRLGVRFDAMAKRYSTATVRSDGSIVPWLAAEGPMAYSPENPPGSNYFFQYGWLMPGLYKNRCYCYFGAPCSLNRVMSCFNIEPFLDFWSKARLGKVRPIQVKVGRRCDGGFTAPIGCYCYRTGWNDRDTFLLIQHGSYLAVNTDEQPLLERGVLFLYRGIGRKTKFS